MTIPPRALRPLAALVAAAALTGCSTSEPAVTFVEFQPIPLEEAAPQLAALFETRTGPRVASLGAGDALGRAVYVNNVILAARMQAEQAAHSLADVPVEDAQLP